MGDRVARLQIAAICLSVAMFAVARPVHADEPVNVLDEDPSFSRREKVKAARTQHADATGVAFMQVPALLPMKEISLEPMPKWGWTVFPVVGGSSDFGILGGVSLSISREAKGLKPYQFQTAIILSASLKDTGSGVEVAQQKHAVRLDWLGLFRNRLRLTPAFIYDRTVNAGYFGLGNASTVAPIDESGSYGKRYQFLHNEVRGRINARITLRGPWSLVVGTTQRYTRPSAYAGSVLEADMPSREPNGSKTVYGTDSLYQSVLQFGGIYDSRDNEVFPLKGGYHEVSMRAGLGFPLSSEVRYAAVTFTARQYLPLFGPLVLAIRALGDFAVGNVPFYDLSQGGTLPPEYLTGGPQGLRGVPNGRFAGLGKVIGNIELRAMLADFEIGKSKFRFGMSGFADGGRVWAHYGDNPRDGSGLGLKYGVGGGVYFQWGVALFRFDIAYSPDARAANPALPIGLYAAESTQF